MVIVNRQAVSSVAKRTSGPHSNLISPLFCSLFSLYFYCCHLSLPAVSALGKKFTSFWWAAERKVSTNEITSSEQPASLPATEGIAYCFLFITLAIRLVTVILLYFFCRMKTGGCVRISTGKNEMKLLLSFDLILLGRGIPEWLG